MKETFVEKTFGANAEDLLAKVQVVLARYASQGYDLSLRQLYYQLVAADLLPQIWADPATGSTNNERAYKNLGNLVSDARLAGLIDWDAIKDRGREMIQNPHWKNPRYFLESVIPQFAIRKWDDQPSYVEVMVEKQALEGVLEPVCDELDIPFTANKGYSSSSAMYECGKRFEEKLGDGKVCYIIYLGDHDPSGIDMTRDVEDRINMFANVRKDVAAQRVALNMDQVRRLRPPENPAKITDSRAASYIEKFGRSSWELDAIEPSALATLVRNAVFAIRDEELWDAAVKREDAMKADLSKFSKTSKFK